MTTIPFNGTSTSIALADQDSGAMSKDVDLADLEEITKYQVYQKLKQEHPGLIKAIFSRMFNASPTIKQYYKPGAWRRNQDMAVIRGQVVQEMYLAGYRNLEIAVELDLTVSIVTADIRRFRQELYTNNQATLAEHTEESVAVIRRQQMLLGQEYNSATIRTRVQIANSISNMEVYIGKFRGTYSTSIKMDIVHQVKLYDFEDQFPDAIIEGISKKIPADKIPDATYDALEVQQKPEFDRDKTVMALPNGNLIEIPDDLDKDN